MASFKSVVLPEPLGPSSTVGAPAADRERHVAQDRRRAGGERDAVETHGKGRWARSRMGLIPHGAPTTAAPLQASALTAMIRLIRTTPKPYGERQDCPSRSPARSSWSSRA